MIVRLGYTLDQDCFSRLLVNIPRFTFPRVGPFPFKLIITQNQRGFHKAKITIKLERASMK